MAIPALSRSLVPKPRGMTSPDQPRQYRPQSAGVSGIGYLIFFSRWLRAPLYVGLIVAQLIYVVVFIVELYHLGEKVLAHPPELKEAEIMLGVLGLIDVVMIANLLIFSAVALAWIDKISSGAHTPAIAASPPRSEYATSGAPSDNELRAAHYEQLARELRGN